MPPTTFKDKKGRDWPLELDVYLVEQIEKRVENVRIDQLVGEQMTGLKDLFGDTVRFVRVLYVMVEAEAVKRAISPEDFGRSLGGDSLEDAAHAFLRALADFIPRQQRALLTALLARGKELAAEQTERALAQIAAYRPPPSTSVTTAAASSDSTPERAA